MEKNVYKPIFSDIFKLAGENLIMPSGWGSVAPKEGGKRIIASPAIKGEKIESFVTFTLNLILKKPKTYRFLNKISLLKFFGLKNAIFSKFSPHSAQGFTFSSSYGKFLDAPMGWGYFGISRKIFQLGTERNLLKTYK